MAAFAAIRIVFEAFSAYQFMAKWALARKLRRLHTHRALQGVKQHFIMTQLRVAARSVINGFIKLGLCAIWRDLVIDCSLETT